MREVKHSETKSAGRLDPSAQLRTMILLEMPWGRDKDPRVPLGHASLLASLRKLGRGEVISIVAPVNDISTSPDRLRRRIMGIARKSYSVDLAIGAYVWSEEVLRELLTQLRDSGFDGRIILGGPQISYSPSGLEDLYPEADVFVRGYGEMALVALFNDPNERSIEGVHFAGGEDTNSQTIVDLSVLPSPWINGDIELKDQGFVRWESQRGCAFSCSFCQHKEAGKRLNRRELDEDRVMSEIDLFCESGVSDIAVLDPIFNMGKLSKKILRRLIEKGYDGRISLQCRAESCDEEFLELCSRLHTRLEFGLQTIHRDEGRAVNRTNNMRFVEKWFGRIKELQIEFEVSIIFGLPEQTLESFRKSVSWCLMMGVRVIKAFPLMLLRGTEVEQRKSEWGLIESNDSMPVVIKSETFRHSDWLEMSRLSEALKETEGNHPPSIHTLSETASKLEIREERFRPEKSLDSQEVLNMKTSKRACSVKEVGA